MDVRVLKILDTSVVVEGFVANGTTQEPRGFNCPDSPPKPMLDALADLEADVLKVLGLGKAAFAGFVRLYGVTAKVAGDSRSYIFHLKLKTDQGETAFNSKRIAQQRDDESGDGVVPDTTLRKVVRLLSVASDYYDGPREQGDFFSQEPAAAEASG